MEESVFEAIEKYCYFEGVEEKRERTDRSYKIDQDLARCKGNGEEKATLSEGLIVLFFIC